MRFCVKKLPYFTQMMIFFTLKKVDNLRARKREEKKPQSPRLCHTLGGIASICLQFVSDFIFSKHCGCTPRGVKRPEILWEIQKYSLPGRPSCQNGVKSKTICHFLRNFDEFLNGFLFYSTLTGWSTWQWVFLNFSQNFWSFDTHDTPGCASAVIWNHLKQI